MANQPGFTPHALEGTAYRLIAPLGGGAVGDVFLGEHGELRRRVVIKLIKAKYIKDEQVVGRLKREARIVSQLRHASLVTIYDLGVAADGRTFIAMEYLDGVDLRHFLRARRRLQVEEACRLMIGVLEGLDAAHQAGVIHRDIKPENIFVPGAGGVKVLDFGVAKPQDSDATSMFTAAGFVIGTPKYMAPEQAIGKSVTAATDVYACGAVLFELITGNSLFAGRDVREVLFHHITTAAPSLAERTGEPFNRALEDVVARALKKEPGERYPRAIDMAYALRRALGGVVSLPPAEPVDVTAATLHDSAFTKPTMPFAPLPADLRASGSEGTTTLPVAATPAAREDSHTRPIAASVLLDGVATTQPAAMGRTEILPVESARAPGRTLRRAITVAVLVLAAATSAALLLVLSGKHDRAPAPPAPASDTATVTVSTTSTSTTSTTSNTKTTTTASDTATAPAVTTTTAVGAGTGTGTAAGTGTGTAAGTGTATGAAAIKPKVVVGKTGASAPVQSGKAGMVKERD